MRITRCVPLPGCPGQPAWACAGFTEDSAVAMLVHGGAVAGWARPLRIPDPEGTVSRLHLRISLAGWPAEIADLGSANGSVLKSRGGDRTLAPFEPMVLDPGASIGIGHRSIQYLASQGVLP